MAYQAEARVVCRVFGTSTEVTILGRNASIDAHPAFNAMSISQRLFNVPATAVGDVPDNDKAVCLDKATAFIKAELPVAYSLDGEKASAIPGHAFIDGRWVPTSAAQVSYAFPLLRNGEPIEDECLTTDPSGNPRSLTMAWSVVVQPR
jgi:hypothetical protein